MHKARFVVLERLLRGRRIVVLLDQVAQVGHVIATQAAPQDRAQNGWIDELARDCQQVYWNVMKNAWAKALDANKKVEVKISPIYEGSGSSPKSFEVKYKIGEQQTNEITFDYVSKGKK